MLTRPTERPCTTTPTMAQSMPRLVNFWKPQPGTAGLGTRISVSSSSGPAPSRTGSGKVARRYLALADSVMSSYASGLRTNVACIAPSSSGTRRSSTYVPPGGQQPWILGPHDPPQRRQQPEPGAGPRPAGSPLPYSGAPGRYGPANRDPHGGSFRGRTGPQSLAAKSSPRPAAKPFALQIVVIKQLSGAMLGRRAEIGGTGTRDGRRRAPQRCGACR